MIYIASEQSFNKSHMFKRLNAVEYISSEPLEWKVAMISIGN